jgi:hypothetical protein
MSSWDHANRVENLGLVWRSRKKINQIINDYLYLPFFLLIILCCSQTRSTKITSSKGLAENTLYCRGAKISIYLLRYKLFSGNMGEMEWTLLHSLIRQMHGEMYIYSVIAI